MPANRQTEQQTVCEFDIFFFLDTAITSGSNAVPEKRRAPKCCPLKLPHFKNLYVIYYFVSKTLCETMKQFLDMQKMVWWFTITRSVYLQQVFFFSHSQDMITLMLQEKRSHWKINDYAFCGGVVWVFLSVWEWGITKDSKTSPECPLFFPVNAGTEKNNIIAKWTKQRTSVYRTKLL